jgi:hypothetical protein
MAFAIALLCAAPTTAGAADLRLVASNGQEEIWLDVDTVRSIRGTSTELGYTQVIVTTLFASPQQFENIRFQATISRLLIRCITVMGSLETLIFYARSDLKGEPVARFDYPTNWRSVDHQTDVGLIWRYVCTRSWEEDR